MKKLYCIICSKYGKSEKPKIPYLLEKRLVLFIICKKCKNEDEKVLKEEKSIKILIILGLVGNIGDYQKIMNQKFRFKKNRWNKKLFNWRNKSKLINEKKHKKVFRVLNYIEH